MIESSKNVKAINRKALTEISENNNYSSKKEIDTNINKYSTKSTQNNKDLPNFRKYKSKLFQTTSKLNVINTSVKKYLNKKTKRNKVNRKDNLRIRFKKNFFKHQQEVLFKMINNSIFCQFNKIKLNWKPSEIYMLFKISENYELLNLKLKDLLSKYDQHNEKEIKKIIESENDLHLNDILNKSIKDLMKIYRGEIECKEYYYRELANSYKNFIKYLEDKRDESYVKDFKECATGYEEFYLNKIKILENNNS